MNLWNNDDALQVIKKGLDTAALRQRVISNNISNINTAGFKRSSVTFEEDLKKALRDEDAGSISGSNSLREVGPKRVKDNRTVMRSDGNNVDIDIEMLNLSSNQIKYNSLTQLISDRYSNMRYIINEGRR